MREGWEYKKLGEVAFYPNKRISLSELMPDEYVGVECMVKDKGGVAFSDELPNVDTAIEFEENDILIGNIRPYLKKIWLSDKRGGASGDVVNIRVAEEYKEYLSACYLYKVLSTDAFFEYDNSNTHGAKMPRGDRKAIAEYRIPIPPKSTQLAIVAELDQINDLIRLKKEQLKEYDNLAQSIFYDMFGDPVENEKGWEVKKLGDVCEIGTGSTPNRKNKDYYIGNIPWVKSTEVCNGFIDETQEMISDEALAQTNCTIYPKDSVLIAMYGQGKTRGQVAILKIDACTNQAVAAMMPSECISANFLFYHLRLLYENIRGMARGGNQANLNLTLVKSIKIILPPLPLQQEFSSRMEQIEKLKAEVQKTITDLETLLASRMQYWFE